MANHFLFIGLGNPGEQFAKTRHNIGRELIESVGKKFNLPDFKFEKNYQSWISEGKIGKNKVVLAYPDTFMNKSGQAVAPLTKFFKIKPSNIFVIHDDSDLELGQTKLSFGRSSAGHKGVESIIKSLKTKEFWRFRVGVGGKKHTEAEKIILKKFTSRETTVVKKVIKKTLEALETTIIKNPEMAMNSYNQN